LEQAVYAVDQIVAHLVGDFILQSDWMAREKFRNSWACFVHVVTYTLPFLLLTQEPVTLLIIAGTHFMIDRWRLPRFLIWAKNMPFPGRRPFSECWRTGFPPDMPDDLSRLLYIIIDGTCHILINGAAIYYFG
jgi:hypothetical protein